MYTLSLRAPRYIFFGLGDTDSHATDSAQPAWHELNEGDYDRSESQIRIPLLYLTLRGVPPCIP